MATPELIKAAVYERRSPVPIARIWENVFDWEHLPFLHRSSFADIKCLEAGDWGWRAELRQTNRPEQVSLMEIRVDRRQRRYVSKLIEGFGLGTEIWTYLDPISEAETQIRVEFNLPIRDPDKAERVGEAYRRLYEQLWDEDEEMMVRRQAFLAQRPKAARETVHLGHLENVKAKLPMLVELGDEQFRIVEIDGEMIAHSCVCPHLQGPLEAEPVSGSVITCPWHGYRFDLRTAKSCDGRKLKMRPAPKVVIDQHNGEVRLEWPSGKAAV